MGTRMRALDAFYTDETKQVKAGDEFEIAGDTAAKELAERGLAELVASVETAPAVSTEAEGASADREAATGRRARKPTSLT